MGVGVGVGVIGRSERKQAVEVKMKAASDEQTAGGVALTLWSAASCLACPTGGQDWANEGGSVAVMEEKRTGSTLGGGEARYSAR